MPYLKENFRQRIWRNLSNSAIFYPIFKIPTPMTFQYHLDTLVLIPNSCQIIRSTLDWTHKVVVILPQKRTKTTLLLTLNSQLFQWRTGKEVARYRTISGRTTARVRFFFLGMPRKEKWDAFIFHCSEELARRLQEEENSQAAIAQERPQRASASTSSGATGNTGSPGRNQPNSSQRTKNVSHFN